MNKKYDFELVDSKMTVAPNIGAESGSVPNVDKTEILVPEVLEDVPSTANDTHPLTQAAADNFPRILDIAVQCVDILKNRELSKAQLKVLHEKRKLLAAEAEAYVKKKNADTYSFKERGEMIRQMLEDYYKYGGKEKLPADAFLKILENTLNPQNKEAL